MGEIPELEKSDIMKNFLSKAISISGRKTSLGESVETIGTVIHDLEKRYDFLKHVQINDTRFSEPGSNTVVVTSGINSINSNDFGKAIQEIMTTVTHSMSKNAGYFFLKELQQRLGDDYYSTMKDMGVDLSLLRLETEVLKY